MQVTRDWQNISRKLPLLTTILLSIAVAASVSIAYRETKRTVVTSAGEHLTSVSRQLASIFAESEAKLRREGTPLSRDSSVHAALGAPDPAALERARAKLAERAAVAPMFGVELWDAHRTRVLAVGGTAHNSATLSPSASNVAPLVLRHDTVLTDIRVPVRDEHGDTLGFVRELSRVSSAQGKQLLGGLIGGRAILLIGNAEGDVWTDLDRPVADPHARSTKSVSRVAGADGEAWIGALAPVTGTPWMIWVARPESDVLSGVHAFLVRMLILAFVVVGLGALGARLLSRHIVGPLTDVTHAAEAMARGDYSIRLVAVRGDEVGRLSQAFNTMALAIDTASVELSNQAVELEAQQVELEESNEELRSALAAATRAQHATEQSHARATAIVAGALDSIISIDENERIVEFNPAAEQLFGYSAAEARGKPIGDLISPTSASTPAAADGQRSDNHYSLNGNAAHGQRLELNARRADGTPLTIELSMSRVPVDGMSMSTCFVRDLSERKKLEAQLQQAQKMEAIGRLAGGVAHDFNNMLTVMISYTDLVLSDGGVADSVRSDLTQVRSAADRAAGLTRQLLAFSRKQVLRPVVLDVNDVVGGVITMLARVMPENIRLSTMLGTALDQVFVDRGQLEQVLMNLAVNARDAMPSGGSLSIETTNTILDATYAGVHGGTPGPHVVLSVRDTGIGMDAPTRDRIFEPFFTTKPLGHGTGLGLATVYGIVQQSGGSIYVYSEPGQGTIFKVYFPAHLGSPLARVETSHHVVRAKAKAILLVEDDPSVREATRAVLRSLGHDVSVADDATAALQLVRSDVPFHVVLTDAVMPGMSGLELAEILSVERPSLPVVLMSGYAEETINFDQSERLGILFVEKPFTAAAIAAALEESDIADIGAGVGAARAFHRDSPQRISGNQRVHDTGRLAFVHLGGVANNTTSPTH